MPLRLKKIESLDRKIYMKNAFRIITLLILQTFVSLQAQQGNTFYKPTDDDNSKYTDVGNIGITITNFGTYGHGFSLWPEQPSCEYPKGSGIEHIYDGGLWVGGFTADDSLGNNINGPFVSTGVIDFSSATQRGSGLEFTNSPGSFVEVRSSLPDSKFFSPKAISHQDFIMDFSDTSTTLSNGEPILLHRPLGVSVHLETYAWNFPFADYFVIFNYYITNVSHKYIDSFYVALWTDAVVRNTIVTSPRTGGFYNHGGNGFNDSLSLAYEFDADGDPGFTDSYIGVQFLGASDQVDSVNYVNWQYRNTTNPNYFSPQDDIERYKKLEGFFGGSNRYNYGISPEDLKIPSNRSMLLSIGNFKNLAPGDTINVTFAIVTAKKTGSDPASLDTEYQKEKLYSNAGWAIRAYRGEDRNGNGIIETVILKGEQGHQDAEIRTSEVVQTFLTNNFKLDILITEVANWKRDEAYEKMKNAGCDIPQEKWFTNLQAKGNTGSASIYVMMEELFNSGKLKKGDKLLCYIPESGRFSTAFMLLEAV